jgi:thioredoxin-like negative regulator of GroEL
MKIIEFYSPNCAPCASLKKELDGFENVEYINVMEDFEKSLEYNVRKAPTVVFIDDGVEIGRFIGFKPKQEIEEFIVKLGGN